jgi:TorA-specific chaperone
MTVAMDNAVIWRWLAGVFAAPLDGAALEASRLASDEIESVAEHPMLLQGLRRMQTALAELPPGEEGVAALALSHTLLFSGVAGPDTVPPYESAFTEPRGRLFGAAEARMRALLRAMDLHVATGVGEPADHIAIELAAMAELVGASVPTASRGALAHALNGWLGDFRDACTARDRCDFYSGAATVAAALAELELATGADGGDTEREGGTQ